MLAHSSRGDGTTSVIMLHGFLGSGRNLGSLARLLTDKHPNLRCVLPDLLGHGVSPPLTADADLTTLAQEVVTLANALALPPPWRIIGHSLGGRVALVVRDLAPQHTGEVVLLDIAPGPILEVANSLTPVLQALLDAPATAPNREPIRVHFAETGISPALADWLMMNLTGTQGELHWRIDREALAELNQRTRGADLWPVLERAQSPTRAIRGSESRFVSEADAEHLQRVGCAVTTLQGAGHFVHVDALKDLVEIL